MLKLEKLTGLKTYMYPSGEIAPPERIYADFPASKMFTHVIEVNGDVCQAVMNLNALRNQYKISEYLTEDEAIEEIQKIINAPSPEQLPTAEDRIAAAMEYQNLLTM